MKRFFTALLLSLAAPAAAQDLPIYDASQFGKVAVTLSQSGTFAPQYEAMIGNQNIESVSGINPRSRIAQYGRAVGKLDILTDTGGYAPCTAFLIDDNRLITNNHCVPGVLTHPQIGGNAIVAVQFHAGYTRDAVAEDATTFHVSPIPLETNEALDYTVLKVIGDANSEFGALELSNQAPRDADLFLIIGHPMGWAQRFSREACQAARPAINGNRVHHTCDTLPGSSGSPVLLDDTGRVVALHSAAAGSVNLAVPMVEILSQSSVLSAAATTSSGDDPALAKLQAEQQKLSEQLAALRAERDRLAAEAEESARKVAEEAEKAERERIILQAALDAAQRDREEREAERLAAIAAESQRLDREEKLRAAEAAEQERADREAEQLALALAERERLEEEAKRLAEIAAERERAAEAAALAAAVEQRLTVVSADEWAEAELRRVQESAAEVNVLVGTESTRVERQMEAQRRRSEINVSSSSEIRTAQRQLRALGLYSSTIDGLVGRGTRAALNTYQTEARLPKTSKFDGLTWTLLMSASKGTWKAPDKLRLVSSLPRSMSDIFASAEEVNILFNKLSPRDITIEPFGAGERMGAFQSLDAVRDGTEDMYWGPLYYWTSVEPALSLVTEIPFGFTPFGMLKWREIEEVKRQIETTVADLNLYTMPCGTFGRSADFWANKPIRTPSDLDGLKIRFPGVPGQVLGRAGVSVQMLPGSEVYQAMATGVIDAANWIGPALDADAGLHETAKTYHYPGFLEPGLLIDLAVNLDVWNGLPTDVQEDLEQACRAITLVDLQWFSEENEAELKRLKRDGVAVEPLPYEVRKALHQHWLDYAKEQSIASRNFASLFALVKKYQTTPDPSNFLE